MMTNKVNEIDLALSVMCAISRRDETLTTVEIAEICGCSRSYISKILNNTLRKLRGDENLILKEFLNENI